MESCGLNDTINPYHQPNLDYARSLVARSKWLQEQKDHPLNSQQTTKVLLKDQEVLKLIGLGYYSKSSQSEE